MKRTFQRFSIISKIETTMHPMGRQWANGPMWSRNQWSPSNRPPILSGNQRPDMRTFMNNNNYNQQFLMPWILPSAGKNGLLPHPLMNSPVRRPYANSPKEVSDSNKRKRNSRSDNNNKRVRLDATGQGECSNNDSTSSPSLEKFIVPVNRGTEEITIAIWDYFLACQMTEDDLKKKLLLRKSLLSVLEDSFENCRLFIVGSSMTGFATKSSDVDMCLFISDDEIHQKREAPSILTAIARALRHCSFVYAPQVIRAKVPILKFRDRISGVECDLNINNTIGVRNTHLLRSYAYIDWRVRPLMLFIKHWARFHDINDASKKTISSYSLSLMLIHFLQVGVNPPVLPCLQRMKPDLFSGKIDVRSLSLKMEKIDFNSQNKATLGELFLGFLGYYTNVFRYDSDVISVRTGKRLKKFSLESDDPREWKFLNIAEPFEGSNTARSVYDLFVFQRILRVFNVSWQLLNQHRNCQAILSHPF